MPISLDEDNALEKVARNTYEDPWLADGIADLKRQVSILREALRPFEAEYYKTHKVIPALASSKTHITLTIEAGWLHAVHAALAATEKKDG